MCPPFDFYISIQSFKTHFITAHLSGNFLAISSRLFLPFCTKFWPKSSWRSSSAGPKISKEVSCHLDYLHQFFFLPIEQDQVWTYYLHLLLLDSKQKLSETDGTVLKKSSLNRSTAGLDERRPTWLPSVSEMYKWDGASAASPCLQLTC